MFIECSPYGAFLFIIHLNDISPFKCKLGVGEGVIVSFTASQTGLYFKGTQLVFVEQTKMCSIHCLKNLISLVLLAPFGAGMPSLYSFRHSQKEKLRPRDLKAPVQDLIGRRQQVQVLSQGWPWGPSFGPSHTLL